MTWNIIEIIIVKMYLFFYFEATFIGQMKFRVLIISILIIERNRVRIK